MNIDGDSVIELANKEISHLEQLISEQSDGDIKDIMISDLEKLKKRRDMFKAIYNLSKNFQRGNRQWLGN